MASSELEHDMSARTKEQAIDLDGKTSRSICTEVGERLRRNLRPESDLPAELWQLLEEMRRRECPR